MHELQLAPCDTKVLQRAIAMQAKFVGGPSFTDCLVMAMADAYSTVCIFGFDATFAKSGYVLPSNE